ncbi:hypothetical protein C2845_PM12G04780 [Panicum miliaceum]|uniref:Uncharacterized protein n=1 Tax=Panicum miliaceum TaxID=4540 RepID=A0A3L6QHT5_PANMI|nr:hypothetical protein C2845_PM12G04780 [Panicum miliaceum]
MHGAAAVRWRAGSWRGKSRPFGQGRVRTCARGTWHSRATATARGAARPGLRAGGWGWARARGMAFQGRERPARAQGSGILDPRHGTAAERGRRQGSGVAWQRRVPAVKRRRDGVLGLLGRVHRPWPAARERRSVRAAAYRSCRRRARATLWRVGAGESGPCREISSVGVVVRGAGSAANSGDAPPPPRAPLQERRSPPEFVQGRRRCAWWMPLRAPVLENQRIQSLSLNFK